MNTELSVFMKEIFTDFFKQVGYIQNFINERKKELQTKAAMEDGPSTRMHTRALRSRAKKEKPHETPKHEFKQVHFGLAINKRNIIDVNPELKNVEVALKEKTPENQVFQRSTRKRVNYALRSNAKPSDTTAKSAMPKTSTKTKTTTDNVVSTKSKTDNVAPTNKTTTSTSNVRPKTTTSKPKKTTIHTTTNLQTKTTHPSKNLSKPTPFTSPIKNAPFTSPIKKAPFISPLKRMPFISPLKQPTKPRDTRNAGTSPPHRPNYQPASVVGGKKRLSGRKAGKQVDKEEECYVWVVDQSLQVSLEENDPPEGSRVDSNSNTIMYYDADDDNSVNNKNNNNINNKNNNIVNKNKSVEKENQNSKESAAQKRRLSDVIDDSDKKKIHRNNNNDGNPNKENDEGEDDNDGNKAKRGLKRKSNEMMVGDVVPMKIAKVVLRRLDDDDEYDSGGKKRNSLPKNDGVEVDKDKFGLQRNDDDDKQCMKMFSRNQINKKSLIEATPHNKKQQLTSKSTEATPQYCNDASDQLLSLHLTNDNIRRKPSKSTPINTINPPKLPLWVHSSCSPPQCNLILSPIDDPIKSSNNDKLDDKKNSKSKLVDKKQRVSKQDGAKLINNEVGDVEGSKYPINGSFSEEFLCTKDKQAFKAPLLPLRPATKHARVLVEPLSLSHGDKGPAGDDPPTIPSDSIKSLKSSSVVIASGSDTQVQRSNASQASLGVDGFAVVATKSKASTTTTVSKSKATTKKKTTSEITSTTTPVTHTTTITTTSSNTMPTTTHAIPDHPTTTTTLLETTIITTIQPIATSTPVMTSSLTSSNASSQSKTYETAEEDGIFENSLSRPNNDIISVKDSVDDNSKNNNDKNRDNNIKNINNGKEKALNTNDTDIKKIDDSVKSVENLSENKNNNINKNNNKNNNNKYNNTSHNKDTSLLKQVLCKKLYSHNTTYNSALDYNNNNKKNKNNKESRDESDDGDEGVDSVEEDNRSIKKYKGNAFVNQSHNSSSYDMTPMREKVYVPATKDNYNICDLSVMDETDDEDQPRKTVPQWARGEKLLREVLLTTDLDHEEVFQGMQCPDLNAIFKHSKRRHKFQLRSSSQYWAHTPARFRRINQKDDIV